MWRPYLPVITSFLLLGCGARTGEDLPNILLITIDTARRDRFGVYGGEIPTPSFDALASRGILCERAVTPSPITWPSHACMFTGLYPIQHGVHQNGTDLLDCTENTMAEILASAGYTTLAFVGSSVLERGLGCERGFEYYADSLRTESGVRTVIPSDPSDWWERSAEEVNAEAVAGLLRCRRPFFAWCHYFDPHSPYQPPSPFAEQYQDAPYDGEIAAVDVRLGELVESVESLSGERPIMIVVLADHGECLGEHDGYVGHAESLHEEVLAIPLILVCPGVLPAGRRFESLFRTIDLLPTILDLFDLPVPKGLEGVSRAEHLAAGKGGPDECFHESCPRTRRRRRERLFAYRIGSQKIWWSEDQPDPRFSRIDSETGLDLFVDGEPEPSSGYRALLETYVQAYFSAASKKEEVDEERLEMLRGIGY